MKDQKCILFVFLIITIITLSGNAFGYGVAYDGVTMPTYNWGPSEPGYNASATLHPGTIDTSLLIMGDFVGRNSSTPNALGYGDSGAAVGWDDAWTSGGNANTNGDALDGLWVQIFSDGGWWDLGSAYSTVAVATSQDHGPYLGEGLEYRLYGTNTMWTGSLVQASLTDVYLDGWRAHNPLEDDPNDPASEKGWLSDDITGVFDLGGSYRYIMLVAWDTSGLYSEPEVDAVAAVVPEPATMLLLGSGLIGLAGFRRKSKK